MSCTSALFPLHPLLYAKADCCLALFSALRPMISVPALQKKNRHRYMFPFATIVAWIRYKPPITLPPSQKYA